MRWRFSQARQCCSNASRILSFLLWFPSRLPPSKLTYTLHIFLYFSSRDLIQNSSILCNLDTQGDFNTIMKLWSMLEYFLSVIAQLFVYCYYATEIRTLVSGTRLTFNHSATNFYMYYLFSFLLRV